MLGEYGFGEKLFGWAYGRIADSLDLPSYALDQLYWQENWQHISRAAFLAGQQKILEEPNWVIDGTFSECGLADRFEKADKVVFLDRRPFICLSRALSRRGKQKERLPQGADDAHLTFFRSLQFLTDILTFNLRDKRKILQLSKKFPDKLVILENWQAEEEFLKQLTSTKIH